MPQIVKLDNFKSGEATENKYGKFEKIFIKRKIKLEDLNKNGYLEIDYDINNNPYLEISSNNSKTIVTDSEIHVDSAKVSHIELKGEDLEDKLSKMSMKLEYLERKVQNLENIEKVVSYDIDEDQADILYLIEFNNPIIGLFGLFTLNDNCKYLYLCYQIDNNISYWKIVHKY